MSSDSRRNLYFNLAVGPIVFAFAMFIGALQELIVEDIWFIPAFLALLYCFLIYSRAPAVVVWIVVPVISLGVVIGILEYNNDAYRYFRYGNDTFTKIKTLIMLAMIPSGYFLLDRLAAAILPYTKFIPAVIAVAGYVAVGSVMYLLTDPYYGYWIKELGWKNSIAIRIGHDQRFRSTSIRLSKHGDISDILCGLENTDYIQFLLDLGADPLAKVNRRNPKLNAIECALDRGSTESLQYLMEATGVTVSQLNLDALFSGRRDYDKDSDYAQMIRFLLDESESEAEGRNAKLPNPNGLLRAMAVRCWSCGPESLEVLLSRGADPKARYKGKETIIDYVVRKKGPDHPMSVALQAHSDR